MCLSVIKCVKMNEIIIINQTDKLIKIDLGVKHDKEPIGRLELKKGESFKINENMIDLLVIQNEWFYFSISFSIYWYAYLFFNFRKIL